MHRGIVCHRNEELLQSRRSLSPSAPTIVTRDNASNGTSAMDLVERLTTRVKELEATLWQVQSTREAASTSSPSTYVPAADSQKENVAALSKGGAQQTQQSRLQPAALSPSERRDSSVPAESSSPGILVNPEIENAATILEFLAWGRRKDPDYREIVTKEDGMNQNQSPGDVGAGNGGMRGWPSEEEWSLSGRKESALPCLQLLLPSRQQLIQIVDYHRDCILWYHGSFHSWALAAEVDDFLARHHNNAYVDNLDNVDLQWLAMLFSVMCGSMACAPRLVARSWGFGKSEQITLANRWFEATTMCLNLADYSARHSIYSVQAISTLTIAAHTLGQSNRQSVLLASAVRVAQNLGLHRLGQEIEDQSPDLVKHEICRRAWSQLCVQDWFNIPFSETYLIHMPSFNTDKPRNCFEEDMQSLSDDIPTNMTYNRLLYDVAILMPQLQDGLNMSNTLYTKYEQVLQSDTKMRTMVTKRIPYYLKNVPMEDDWPCYVSWSRKALTFSLSHKIIMIHRKFLGLSFTNPAFHFTRKTCVAASKTILREQIRTARDSKDTGPVLWIYHAFSVAASVSFLPSPLVPYIYAFISNYWNPQDCPLSGHVPSFPTG